MYPETGRREICEVCGETGAEQSPVDPADSQTKHLGNTGTESIFFAG